MAGGGREETRSLNDDCFDTRESEFGVRGGKQQDPVNAGSPPAGIAPTPQLMGMITQDVKEGITG